MHEEAGRFYKHIEGSSVKQKLEIKHNSEMTLVKLGCDLSMLETAANLLAAKQVNKSAQELNYMCKLNLVKSL